MDILRLFGFAIIALVLIVLLKKQKSELAVVLSIVSSVSILLLFVFWAEPFFEQIISLVNLDGENEIYITTLMKILGISILSQFVFDSCCDAGESALGRNAMICGKISVVIICLPIISKAMEVIYDILSS